MKFRFSIGRKIGTGFGILLLLTMVVFILTTKTIQNSREVNSQIVEIHSPSVDALQEVKLLVIESQSLIIKWVNHQSGPEWHEKRRLVDLINKKYEPIQEDVSKLSKYWSPKENELKQDVFNEIEVLFTYYKQIMESLNSFDSYLDPIAKLESGDMIEVGGSVDQQIQKVILILNDLISRQRLNTRTSSKEMITSYDFLEFVVQNLGFALVVGGILIAWLTVRTIVKPVSKLKRLIQLLGKGIIPEEKMKARNDEIGEMSTALNDLVTGFKRTVTFAKEVGSGNFESEYQPLSEQDNLGHELLKMRTDLHTNEQMLEQKVKERTEEVVSQKEEIETQKRELEVLYKHTTDSIKYAKRIQEAILPPKEEIERLLPKSFILYKPKDIVSGDFYWLNEIDNKVLIAAVDCTGHGVPGAFMTIVGHNGLNQALTEVGAAQPAAILDALNKGMAENLHQGGDGSGNLSEVKDGMDAAMCSVDLKKKEIQFAGAFNPLYLIRNGNLQEIKGDKFPIGAYIGDELQSFTNHTLQLEKGDTVYLFSDGYADQFGGPRGKKFMYKNFRDTLLEMQKLTMPEQKAILDKKLSDWKGDLEQVDDILVIGFRV